MDKIERLLLTRKTIFTTSDIAVYWQIHDRKKLTENIKYYLRTGKFLSLKKGIYALSKNYSELELAQKLIPISYISFYTALAIHGIIFQFYATVHSMALLSKTFSIEDKICKYHQLKKNIFFNKLGIKQEKGYSIADPERAICDSLYLIPGLSFDNTKSINKDYLEQICAIYNNRRLEMEVSKIISYA